MINVTKTFLPPFEEYRKILQKSWDKGWLTNNGELVKELESKLQVFLNSNNLLYCTNGTIVLQMALKALEITKEVITTPFSYVATCNAIIWENCKPVFVDIDPETLNIDPSKIEEAITPDTQAILATHVYGYPCDVVSIDNIAKRHNLKVIYDAAHAFGITYKNKSIFSYGDISTCSFHATKIFHTVEGGSITCANKKIAEKLILLRSFGHIGEEYFSLGVNGKNSEFHAAMGLAVLPYYDQIKENRRRISSLYDILLKDVIQRPAVPSDLEYNFAYYPVIFDSTEDLLRVTEKLNEQNIFPRRYFFPSLNTLPHTKYLNNICPISEDISKRVLCLPLFEDLKDSEAAFIANIIIKELIQTTIPI